MSDENQTWIVTDGDGLEHWVSAPSEQKAIEYSADQLGVQDYDLAARVATVQDMLTRREPELVVPADAPAESQCPDVTITDPGPPLKFVAAEQPEPMVQLLADGGDGSGVYCKVGLTTGEKVTGRVDRVWGNLAVFQDREDSDARFVRISSIISFEHKTDPAAASQT
ncbi:hypothetical protein [Mycolicibacterium sphagni]|uniref:hypothetical protein n=1 Tax=Mycolicibacterium sphagni TaxID=1786 RepID=UPI0021F3A165|nr:hypothetical protein [Mycolicibacterium sphagni]MCV7174824.1 hypothetical protein [Mycolicibacterium sphagni]